MQFEKNVRFKFRTRSCVMSELVIRIQSTQGGTGRTASLQRLHNASLQRKEKVRRQIYRRLARL